MINAEASAVVRTPYGVTGVVFHSASSGPEPSDFDFTVETPPVEWPEEEEKDPREHEVGGEGGHE